ncbi:MAG: hypothetical protein IT374_21415 [Polyangiaceae bacterium]|nr:hypothetical protein [Polyangiaceae bacterium]
MALDLARRLVSRGLVQKDEASAALAAHARGDAHFVRALVASGAISDTALFAELAGMDLPVVHRVVPLLALCDALPGALVEQLLALPVREDPRTQTIDVAAVDPLDAHVARELSHQLGAPVRLVGAPLSAVDASLAELSREGPGTGEFEVPSPPAFPLIDRKTPPYLARPVLDDRLSASVPRLKTQSDIPIPLVRRSAPRLSVAPAVDAAPPATSRAPRVSLPPRAADPGPVLGALRRATSRDELLDLMLNGLAMVCGKAGVFAATRGEFRGVRASESLAGHARVRELVVPAEGPSVFATAALMGHYLGPVPPTPVHAALREVLGASSSEIAVAPVRVEGVLALLTLQAEIDDTMLATKRAEDVARAAGEALTRILHRDRQAPR